MSLQLAFNFDSVPLSCPVQERYHAIAPVLSGNVSSFERAKQLNLSYSTVTRWLARFREDGMPGLFLGQFQREPYTPEKVVVSLLFYKSCLPGASYRELARVVNQTHKVNLHHETVKTLLDRYFFWKHDEFRRLVRYPIPAAPEEKRLEMVKLARQGWSETGIAKLLVTTRKTVRKWIRRSRRHAAKPESTAAGRNDWLFDLSHAPLNPRRKVYFSAIHACLQIQKKYPAAGWFRVQGYLSRDYRIELGETTIKKVMKLNRRLHLVPPKPIKLVMEKEVREGPPRSAHPFEHAYIDIRYLDAKPEQTQLYSCLLLEGFSRTILAGSLSQRQDLGTVLRLYYLSDSIKVLVYNVLMKTPTNFITDLSPAEVEQLIENHQTHPSFRVRNRSHAILLSFEGSSVDAIAIICRVNRNAVSSWLEQWRKAKFDGLHDGARSGRPKILTPEEEEQAVAIALENPRFVGRQIPAIKAATGKYISALTLQNLLKKKITSGSESS